MKTVYSSSKALRLRVLKVILNPDEMRKILGGENIAGYVRRINKKLILHHKQDSDFKGSDISDRTVDVYVGDKQLQYLGPTSGVCTCPFQMSEKKWDFMIELHYNPYAA